MNKQTAEDAFHDAHQFRTAKLADSSDEYLERMWVELQGFVDAISEELMMRAMNRRREDR